MQNTSCQKHNISDDAFYEMSDIERVVLQIERFMFDAKE